MYSITSKSYVDDDGNLFFDVSFQENDVLIEKRIDVIDYISLLSNVEVKERYVDVPLLPTSVIKCKISANASSSFGAVLHLPAKKRTFFYLGQMMEIPFPSLVAYVEVENGIRKATELYALATDNFSDDTQLMRYPFGNVNSLGSCCFGNIVVKDLSDVSDAPKVLELFLCGETNNDYYEKELLDMTQGELLEYLRDKEKYPEEMLRPVYGKSIADLLKMASC